MNNNIYSGFLYNLLDFVKEKVRFVGVKKFNTSFSLFNNQIFTIQKIYVINLDRKINRWKKVKHELKRLKTRNKRDSLNNISRRFSAIDARYNSKTPSPLELKPTYLLAEQLFVEPVPSLTEEKFMDKRVIKMSSQEIAVALSHIEVWKLISSGKEEFALILEDDIYFRRKSIKIIDRAWSELKKIKGNEKNFDVLYLSYEEAQIKGKKEIISNTLFKPETGIWQLSGYVISKKGAKKLLELMPVKGPVDLWINHQFKNLDVYALSEPVIKQRSNNQSDNSYSVLPVLSKVGVLNYEKPILFDKKSTPKPVFGIGPKESGLSSLSMALSILGYRCCSDLEYLPEREHYYLENNKKKRIFDAYVNVGSFNWEYYIKLKRIYPKAKFIITKNQNQVKSNFNFKEIEKNKNLLLKHRNDILILPNNRNHKWDILCEYLNIEHPACPYPELNELEQREVIYENKSFEARLSNSIKMEFDKLPWIIPEIENWSGIQTKKTEKGIEFKDKHIVDFRLFDYFFWDLLDDTFPSNLSIFNPQNFVINKEGLANLILKKEDMSVREYSSASIATKNSHHYGKFSCSLKPVKEPGLITGVFLHRNSPRQEIDIEFIGKDTSIMLINVYYNPGIDGTKLEYGYRGTPVRINLGFDASMEFHEYTIEWFSDAIKWKVDKKIVYERKHWNPTPIPHLPMKFHVNLWHTRSEELAGKLNNRNLPAQSIIKSIKIESNIYREDLEEDPNIISPAANLSRLSQIAGIR